MSNRYYVIYGTIAVLSFTEKFPLPKKIFALFIQKGELKSSLDPNYLVNTR